MKLNSAPIVPHLDMQDLTREVFLKEFQKSQHPVLIQNFSGALDLVDWSVPSLKRIGKEGKVCVRFNEQGVFNPLPGAKTGGITEESMLFSDALDHIFSEQGKYSYMQQSRIDRDLPDLAAKITAPQLIGESKKVAAFLWISGAACKSTLHFDYSDNFLCQVSGEKQVILFPPAEYANLYPAVDTKAAHCSHFDVFDPDLEKFPLYREARKNEVRLQLLPGDVLYIPKRWWHAVETVKPSISVNFWWDDTVHYAMRRVVRRILHALKLNPRLLWRL